MPCGFSLIISAPSGAGKSTVCRKLLERDKTLKFSLSCTSRQPRPAEKNGRDYFFLDIDEFKKRIRRDEFLEWAIVHGNYYGTPKAFFDEQVKAGRVLILAIDVQGAGAIRRKRPETVTVFLVPPSWRSLEERLHSRRQDPTDVVQKRLLNASAEMKEAKHYDYIVVNDSLEKAVKEIETIIAAEKLKTPRQDLAALGIPELTGGRRRESVRSSLT